MYTPVLLYIKVWYKFQGPVILIFSTLTIVSIVYITMQNFPGYSHHVVDHVKGSHHIPCMPQTSER